MTLWFSQCHLFIILNLFCRASDKIATNLVAKELAVLGVYIQPTVTGGTCLAQPGFSPELQTQLKVGWQGPGGFLKAALLV